MKTRFLNSFQVQLCYYECVCQCCMILGTHDFYSASWQHRPSPTSCKLCYEKHGPHPFLILPASDAKPGQIFCWGFLCPARDVTVLFWFFLLLLLLLMLSFFLSCRPQTLSRSLCRSASATSPSRRGTSPSTTAPLWSSCPAACRELTSAAPPN